MGYSRESSGHLYNDAYLFCTGIIVVLDLSRKESLMVAHEMVNKAKQFYKSPLIVSVGNQQDLKHLREVSDDAFNAFAKEHDIRGFMVSTRDNMKLEFLSDQLVCDLMAKFELPAPKEELSKIKNP